MTETIHPMGGRSVWGSANRGPDGKPIAASNCRACVHWQHTGRIQGQID